MGVALHWIPSPGGAVRIGGVGVGIWGDAGCFARPWFSDRPSGALVFLVARVPMADAMGFRSFGPPGLRSGGRLAPWNPWLMLEGRVRLEPIRV